MSTTEVETRGNAPLTMTIEDGIAIVRLDQPGRPVNIISRELMEGMEEVLDRLDRGEADGVVIISGKPGVWIAGADIDEFRNFRGAADAEALSRTGHALLRRIEGLHVPVVAAIDGVALGGGLELALACTYRIASDSPKTKVGLPEVQLGILPGAGGSQRLPRLIGLRAALDMMLTGKQLDPRRARKAGVIDEIVPAAILEEVAVRRARELASGTVKPRAARPKGSPQWVENLPGMRGIIMKKARQGVISKTKGLYPAPLRILDVVGKGIDMPLEEGLRLEAAAFGELSVTPEAQSLIHVFFATTAAKNVPAIAEGAEARDVSRVAIVGAGFMGAGIATVSAESGLRVRLKDLKEEAAARGLATAISSIRKRASRRRKPEHETQAIVDRVEATTDYSGFGTADLVLEAVFEDIGLKHRVLREIEGTVRPETVIGSNTSTIPIADLAEGVQRPGSLIGLHFFSPVEKMPLLEIIVTHETDPDVIATSHSWGKRIGKTPIIVNDGPGFYVNRILGPYMNEAAILLREGVAIESVDQAMEEWGFPVGPITLFDEVGLDVAAKSGRIIADAFPDRVQPNDVLEKMIADDRMGRKNGRGFYRYEDGGKKGPDDGVYLLVGAEARREMPRDEIQERLALGMINEAVRCLEDGILMNARDGDVGAVMGIGFPPFRGGPFWYIDQVGAPRVVERLRVLQQRFGDRFTPAPLLARAAEAGDTFSEG